MPKIACPSGRTRISGGKTVAVWHKKDGTVDDCPICFKGVPSVSPATEPAPTPPPASGGAPEKVSVPSPASPAKKPGLMRRLGFGDRETSPELPSQPPKNQDPEFYVSSEDVQRFANLCYGAGRLAFNAWDRYAMTKEAGMKPFVEAHPDLLKLSEYEVASIKIDPRLDFWGKFATGFTRLLGARTQDQAHGIIGWLDLFARFAKLATFGSTHVIDSFRAGKPYRAAKAAAKKAAAEAARKKVEVKQHVNPSGEGGGLPTVGPAPLALAG